MLGGVLSCQLVTSWPYSTALGAARWLYSSAGRRRAGRRRRRGVQRSLEQNLHGKQRRRLTLNSGLDILCS